MKIYIYRKPGLMSAPVASADSSSRLNTTAYPPANGYDYYRRPAAAPERSNYGGAGNGQNNYAAPPRGSAGYDRPAAPQRGASGGGYGMQQQQQNKPYDSQSNLQTRPIFF